ncbi:MAG: HDOD domain-containing protein, partial [Longimicrobiales bacterium]
AREEGKFVHEAENDVFGFSQAAVGEALVEAWSLPSVFGSAIAHQYQPQRAIGSTVEASAVHLAGVMATGMGWGSAGDTMVLPLAAPAWDVMGLPAEVLPQILDEANRQYDAATQAVAGAMD